MKNAVIWYHTMLSVRTLSHKVSPKYGFSGPWAGWWPFLRFISIIQSVRTWHGSFTVKVRHTRQSIQDYGRFSVCSGCWGHTYPACWRWVSRSRRGGSRFLCFLMWRHRISCLLVGVSAEVQCIRGSSAVGLMAVTTVGSWMGLKN